MEKQYSFNFNELYESNKQSEGADIKVIEKGKWELHIHMANVTSKEKKVIQKGKLRYGSRAIQGIVFTVFKFGSSFILEAPYILNLNENPEDIMENKIKKDDIDNVLLTIRVYDMNLKNQEVVTREIKLNNQFYKKFVEQLQEESKNELTRSEYSQLLSRVLSRYSSKKIFDMSLTYLAK